MSVYAKYGKNANIINNYNSKVGTHTKPRRFTLPGLFQRESLHLHGKDLPACTVKTSMLEKA